MHQGIGRSTSTIRALHLEVERLEIIKKENIEQFIINLRDELHSLWEQCYYSSDQINSSPRSPRGSKYGASSWSWRGGRRTPPG